MVRSSSVVLPAPGELTRLSARICRPRNQPRFALGEAIVLGEDVALEADHTAGMPVVARDGVVVVEPCIPWSW